MALLSLAHILYGIFFQNEAQILLIILCQHTNNHKAAAEYLYSTTVWVQMGAKLSNIPDYQTVSILA